MKISEAAVHGHPVLAPWTDDIEGYEFDATIVFRENPEAKAVELRVDAVLDHQGIRDLIDHGKAVFGCSIRCRETGLRRLQQFAFPGSAHAFSSGALLGRVAIRPLVWTVEEIPGLSLAGMAEEFGDSIDVPRGEFIAIGDEQTIDVSRPPLPSVESIFEIKSSDDIEEGKFEVDPSGDRVVLRIAPDTFRLLQELRETGEISRSVVMNSVYVPMIMMLLDRLRDGTGEFEGNRWLAPFVQRCELLEIDLDDPELFSDAQALLAGPFRDLSMLVEERS